MVGVRYKTTWVVVVGGGKEKVEKKIKKRNREGETAHTHQYYRFCSADILVLISPDV